MITRRALLALLIVAVASHAHAFAQTPSPAPAPAAASPASNSPPAAAQNTAAPVAATPSAASANTPPTAHNLYCPDINKLTRKDMFWGAPGGWRSYSQSFVSTIASFSGAQWVGINVGKMLCVYKGKETFEFPVVLQNDQLTPAPEGDKWIKQSGGYINCLSGDILDCPFKFQEEKTDSKSVYKELDFFKGKDDYLKDDPRQPK